jgi:hypothetical protein
VRRSETIVALVKSLAAAQAEIQPPTKSKTASVGTYSYKYADLAAVREAYQGPLSKQGLIVSHSLAPVDGHIVLSTTLLHTSGEWIASDYPIPVFAKPQEQGSALTYFKRYNVCALLDVVAEDDDDGKQAQEAATKKKPSAVADFDPAPEPADKAAERRKEVIARAMELSDKTKEKVDDVIKKASSANDRSGKPASFDGKTIAQVGNVAWLDRTLNRLVDQLSALETGTPGADEPPF